MEFYSNERQSLCITLWAWYSLSHGSICSSWDFLNSILITLFISWCTFILLQLTSTLKLTLPYLEDHVNVGIHSHHIFILISISLHLKTTVWIQTKMWLLGVIRQTSTFEASFVRFQLLQASCFTSYLITQAYICSCQFLCLRFAIYSKDANGCAHIQCHNNVIAAYAYTVPMNLMTAILPMQTVWMHCSEG